MNPESARELAEAIRAACLEAAKKGYAEAAMSGLCHEGAVEASVGAISTLDLKPLLAGLEQGKKPG